ncbi:MAG: DUF1648 domain-containing protein [Ignavibacteria bacterium]|nr:DUF1648 domain-containing protein [Ignavibacteria bacterium]
MISSKYPSIIFYFVIVVALTIPAFYYNNLPVQIASHFNAKGQADGWMNKSSYMLTNYLILIAMIIMFLSINFFIKKAPDSMINIPNKKYWFDPARKETAINVVKNFIYLMGAMTISFITLISWEVYKANLNRTYNLGNSMWFYFSILFTGTIFFVIKMYYYFNKIENH